MTAIDAAAAFLLTYDIHRRAVEIIDREGITGIGERQRRYDQIVGRIDAETALALARLNRP